MYFYVFLWYELDRIGIQFVLIFVHNYLWHFVTTFHHTFVTDLWHVVTTFHHTSPDISCAVPVFTGPQRQIFQILQIFEDQVKIPEQLLCGAVGPNGRDLPKAGEWTHDFQEISGHSPPSPPWIHMTSMVLICFYPSNKIESGSMNCMKLSEIDWNCTAQACSGCQSKLQPAIAAGAWEMQSDDCIDATRGRASHCSHRSWYRGAGGARVVA